MVEEFIQKRARATIRLIASHMYFYIYVENM
jgi:hypothetical protein